MKKVLPFLVCLALSACSSAPTIIEKPIPVIIPELRDTTIILRDTVLVKDSVWYGEVTDSLGKVIGDLTVYFKKKIASLNLKRDTVIVFIKDTTQSNSNLDPFIRLANDNFSWWEKGILYGGLGTIISFLIFLRVKRGKIL